MMISYRNAQIEKPNGEADPEVRGVWFFTEFTLLTSRVPPSAVLFAVPLFANPDQITVPLSGSTRMLHARLVALRRSVCAGAHDGHRQTETEHGHGVCPVSRYSRSPFLDVRSWDR